MFNLQSVSEGKSILLICMLTVALTGCATSKATYLPDGSQGHSISCDGAAVGISVCFEKAGQICGSKGYDLISREGQVIPFGTASANNQGAFISYGAFNTKSIMIRCKQ
ncbi:hypothetical protein [Rheinheimera pleomorphica]|uniref:hypothetical protein n=1 Tax=Rheinheimera pleomorphica TaxID=2703963 RepID=UPI0014238452|nr:hypothetical protein [Rheinheimera pleomorphica]